MSCVKQHNYVISLTRETKRRKHIEQEFDRQNILFSFFDAVTPDRIEDVAKKFNIILRRALLIPPHKAILMSNLRIIKQFIPFIYYLIYRKFICLTNCGTRHFYP